MSNIRRERFIKIAEKRINRLLEDFRLFGNCSNKGNYEYNPEEIAAMFQLLDREYAAMKQRFEEEGIKKEFKFNDIQRNH